MLNVNSSLLILKILFTFYYFYLIFVVMWIGYPAVIHVSEVPGYKLCSVLLDIPVVHVQILWAPGC